MHVGSIAADKGAGSYGAAKAALASWSIGLSAELGPRGVTSNVVAAVHFLASAGARHVSGQVVQVNGGAFVTR